MEAAIERSYEDAALHFEKAVGILREKCACKDCCPADHITIAPTDEMNSIPISLYSIQYVTGEGYCLLWLALVILHLLRSLSTIGSMPNGLRLKRSGLESLYRQMQMRSENARRNSGVISLLGCLDYLHILGYAAMLFSRLGDLGGDDIVDRTSVIVSNGLCFFLDATLKLSDQTDDISRVHILPGHTERHGKIYNQVTDGRVSPPDSLLSPGVIILPILATQYKAQVQLIRSITVQPTVTEAPDYLQMSYELKTRAGTCFVGPRKLTGNMHSAVNRVSCTGIKCRPFARLAQFFTYRLNGCGSFDNLTTQHSSKTLSKPTIFLFGDSLVARCAALTNTTQLQTILQGRECIACCARTALEYKNPGLVDIISHLTVEDMQQLVGDDYPLVIEA